MAFQRRHIEEPTDVAGFMDRGHRYSRNGVYHRAIDDYTKALEINPEYADGYYHRGCSWYEVEHFDDALADLNRAIELDPEADSYYGQRALVYIFTDRPGLAQADEEKCEELRIKAQEG